MQEYIVVNFSGGKDSTAMLLHMIELGEHIDEVVCCDTYKEFPAMYRHIDKIRKIVESADIKFSLLKNEKSFDEIMFEHKRSRGKYKEVIGKGWATSRIRWCTGCLKKDITNRHLKPLKKSYNVIECDGIAFDEQYRLNRKNQKQLHKRHPLVEWGWTESDCLQYCYERGFDWEGLYEIFDRVSCWCCPLTKLENVRKLYRHYPELWEELKRMDKMSWNQFRADYSVLDLEKRFNFEAQRTAKGLSITNREFYKELKERLKPQ